MTIPRTTMLLSLWILSTACASGSIGHKVTTGIPYVVVEVQEGDVLRAYDPLQSRIKEAGKGVEGLLDTSSGCGCAEGTSSVSGGLGGDTTVDPSKGERGFLRVVVPIPKPVATVSPD